MTARVKSRVKASQAANKDSESVTSLVFCGRGGQGVLFASEVLAMAAMLEGFDVKKSEVHGMAQRGGSVVSQVRFGKGVYSPLVLPGTVDFVVALDETEGERYRRYLNPGGKLVSLSEGMKEALPDSRTENVAVVGALSKEVPLSDRSWKSAIAAVAPPRTVERNLESFALGRGGGI